MSKITIEVTYRPSFRTELEDWAYLLRRRDRLSDAIEKQRETRIQLNYRLTPDGILGTIIQQYNIQEVKNGVLIGELRGPGVSDKTGNLVATSTDGIDRATNMMDKALTDYLDTCDRITRIEAEVGMLMDEPKPYKSVVTMYYRDDEHWYDVVKTLNVDKSTMYRWISEAIELIDHSIWRG